MIESTYYCFERDYFSSFDTTSSRRLRRRRYRHLEVTMVTTESSCLSDMPLEVKPCYTMRQVCELSKKRLQSCRCGREVKGVLEQLLETGLLLCEVELTGQTCTRSHKHKIESRSLVLVLQKYFLLQPRRLSTSFHCSTALPPHLTSTAVSDSAADGDSEHLAVEYHLASDALVVAV